MGWASVQKTRRPIKWAWRCRLSVLGCEFFDQLLERHQLFPVDEVKLLQKKHKDKAKIYQTRLKSLFFSMSLFFVFKLQRWYISNTAKRRSFRVVWWSVQSFQPYMVTCVKRSRCTAIGMWSRLKKKSNSTCCEGRKIKTDVKLSLTVVTFRKQQQQRVRMLSFWKRDTFLNFFLHTFNREHSTMKTCRRLHTKAGGVCGAKARGHFAAAGLPAHLKITSVLTWNTHMWQLDKNWIDWHSGS